MSSYREMIYMCLDRLRQTSDDSHFNDEHVRFLLDKYRSYVLRLLWEKKKLLDIFTQSDYQTLCLDLAKSFSIDGTPCEGMYLRSVSRVPDILAIESARIYAGDFLKSDVTLVPCERMRFVGHNRWLRNIIYACIAPDRRLYLTSSNPQMFYLTSITLSAVFDDAWGASELLCCAEDGNACDPYDSKFPISEAYAPQVMDLVVTALGGSLQIEDDRRNDSDDSTTVPQVAQAAKEREA